MAKIKIIALLPLLRFGLPQSEGQEVSVEKKQGDEIIEAGFGKLASDVEKEKAAEKAAAEKAESKAKAAAEKAESEAKAVEEVSQK